MGGAAGAIWCVGEWAESGYANLNYNQFLRPFVLSLASILVAGQIFFTAFFSASFSEFFKHRVDGDGSGS